MKQSILFASVLIALIIVIPCSAFINYSSDTLVKPSDSKNVQTNPSSSIDADPPDQQKDSPLTNDIPISKATHIKQPKTIKVYLHLQDKVEEMPMEEYLKGVVLAEMPATFETEALKAQAVLANTYALRVIETQKVKPYTTLKGGDISSDFSRHQAYLSKADLKKKFGNHYDLYYKKVSDCVNAVLSQILTYNDELIVAAFHAISSGNTENSKNVWGKELPYLVKRESKGDELAPKFETSVTMSSKQVQEILSKKYPSMKFTQPKDKWFVNPTYTESQYISSITILGKTFTGSEFRSLFGLRSADINITFANDQFTFQTKGYGHGVGMSQYGANYLAQQNKTYQEILAHYYPNTSLTQLNKNPL